MVSSIILVSSNIDESLSNELTDILLEGDAVAIEMEDKNSGSALRALRKLSIDYEIIDWTKIKTLPNNVYNALTPFYSSS